MTTRRRAALILLTLGAVSWAGVASAADRVYRVGFLGQTSQPEMERQISGLREGLRAAGYEEGNNLVMHYRWAERKLERLPALARELVDLKLDALVIHGPAGARAARQATSSIPIVSAALGAQAELETTVKWLELLKRTFPTIRTIGWLDVSEVEGAAEKENAAARALGFTVQREAVKGAGDIVPALERIAAQAQAVVVPNSALLDPLAGQIAVLTTSHRIPSIGPVAYARAGGLMGYGPDGPDLFRRAGGHVAAILRGAKPGDPAAEAPTKMELTLNLKTARTMALRIPPEVRAQASQTIE